MSSWYNLGSTEQSRIFETLYKELYGYPNAITGSTFNQEIQQFIGPTVYSNRIFVDDIPSSAPSDLS